MIRIRLPLPSRRDLARIYNSERRQYELILNELQKELRSKLQSNSLEAGIKYRVKSFESCYAKIINRLKCDPKPEETELIEITDLLGIRLVCPFIEDLATLEDVLPKLYRITEIERKGAGRSSQEFGYDSTHYLIEVPSGILELCEIQGSMVFELQLRTILQDAWAEVEHELMYKTEFTPFDEPLRRKLAALNANLSLSDIIFQEIRDYQRQLQQELQKRRRSFYKRIHEADQPNLSKRIPAGARRSPYPDSQPAEDEVVIHRNGDTVDNMLLRALLAHNKGRLLEAIGIYTRIISEHPDHRIQAMIHTHRGMAFFAQSRYEEAVQDFTRTLELDPSNTKALYYRGVVFRLMGRLTDALQDLNTCLEVDTYQFDPLYARCHLYFQLGDYTQALSDCEKALDLDPDSQQAALFRNTITERMEYSK